MLAILMGKFRAKRKRKLKSDKEKHEMVCCRTCLATEDLHPIFCEEGSDQKRSEELKLITGLEIKMNDGLPQKICAKCVDALSAALKFRRTSEKASDTLSCMGYKTKNSTHILKSQRVKHSPKKTSLLTDKNEILDDYDGYNDFGDDFNDYAELKDNINEIKTDFNEYSETNTKKDVIGAIKKVPMQYKCDICNKEFKMRNTYRAHMRFHTNFCVCELCGKKCRNNNLLLLHKRGRHNLERIHKCKYCEYSSANKEGLIIHERLHTGEKPYVCDHCGASFHRRSNLVQHIAIHLPEKNFQCQYCPKRVASRKFLQIHVHNAHTGRRYAYPCPACSRSFDKPNKLRAHLRARHAIERVDIVRKECELCHKKFHSQKFVRSHKFKMHQTRRYSYVCHVCRATFTTTDSARKHLARSHGIPREQQGQLTRIPNKHNIGKVTTNGGCLVIGSQ